ncbi:hypothetical protein GCM10017691_54510 [Pseudonocardia petroleophila]|uniref:SipW-cognate class signal peptide n=1 Tax=Pseudonocardia petroleophila TaxID=37331 RepID=A0A7G7MNV0_9PSEU|nr:TasA family protein [Pseudonocardia petroleophila]QNG54461.1 hypothetical protein H6H00_11570 [Pseudonocardia petroleophila]
MSILQKNKKVAAGIGVAAVAAAAIALGAGTYAAFSDTEQAPNATFAAGTLNLTVGAPTPATPVVISNLKPGDLQNFSIEVDNTGTVDGNLTASYTVSGTENGCAEPETDAERPCDDGSELLEQLIFVYQGSDAGPVTAAQNTSIPLGALPAVDAPKTINFGVRLPASATNEVMTDTATLSITFTLTQPTS